MFLTRSVYTLEISQCDVYCQMLAVDERLQRQPANIPL